MKCGNMAPVSLEMEDAEWIHDSAGVGQSRIENEIEKYTVLELAQVSVKLMVKNNGNVLK